MTRSADVIQIWRRRARPGPDWHYRLTLREHDRSAYVTSKASQPLADVIDAIISDPGTRALLWERLAAHEVTE